MTQRKSSLRLRILISFVIVGAVLGPLLTTLLLWATYTIEENAVEQATAERLQEVIAAPDEFGLRYFNEHSTMLVLTKLNVSELPRTSNAWPTACTNTTAATGWMVAIGTTPQGAMPWWRTSPAWSSANASASSSSPSAR